MALSDDYQRGLIQKSTYIRLAIASPRHDQGDSYQVVLPLAGVTLAEVFSEASLLVRDEFLDLNIAPFTITWTQPELLPSFSPSAVQIMQVGGRGYLYFALGADNQGKIKTQQIDPTRLYSFYRMPRVDFLAELGRLLETRTATTDITNLSVRWLNKSAPAAREFGSIADVVTQLRKEITDAIALIPPSGVKPEEFLTAFNLLTDEINERQLRGDYVLTSDPRLSDARTPLVHAHQDLVNRLTAIEIKLAATLTPTPTPIPTPTPTSTSSTTDLYFFDYASLKSNKFAPSGGQITFQDAEGAVRNGGQWSAITPTSLGAEINLVAGNYQLICNCKLEATTDSHEIYWGNQVQRISNLEYADVSIEFTLSESAEKITNLGQRDTQGSNVGCLIKNFRIVRV